MKNYQFILKFSLSHPSDDANNYIERLAASGCDDALIGVGINGRIALEFCRDAKTAINAITSAIKDVKKVIPHASLIEATPDFVGISDIAEVMGFSRQNMRKIVLSHKTDFPPPIHDGKQAIWHLANVLNWFKNTKNKMIEAPLLDTAEAAMQINIIKETSKLNKSIHSQIYSVLT